MALPFIANSSKASTPGDVAVGGNSYLSTLFLEGSLATAQAVATGNAAILIPSGTSYVRITAAAATTGASLPAGTHNGQILIISISTAAANTVTMAAAGTSRVAAGTTCVLAGLEAHMFIWDGVGSLWYVVGPAAN